MTRKQFQTLFAIGLFTCLSVIYAFGQDYKSLVGKWSMTSETDNDSVKWTLVLKESDGKLTGFISAGEAEQPVKNFTYVDNVLKFKVPYEGEEYDIELKAAPEKLDGTWSGNGGSGKTSGIRI